MFANATCNKDVARAISLHVISAPISTQILRKGKLPTVVSGAKYLDKI